MYHNSRKRWGQHISPSTTLPYVDDEEQLRVKPMAVLNKRLVTRNNNHVVQLLIQWSNAGPGDSTWEYWDFIHQTFPSFNP